MQSKYISLLLIAILLGQSTLPITSFISNHSIEQITNTSSCCKKMKAKKASDQSSCKKQQSSKHDKKSGCANQCNDFACNCINPTFSGNVLETPIFHLTVLHKKNKFFYKETYPSSGFLSIWLPPVIS